MTRGKPGTWGTRGTPWRAALVALVGVVVVAGPVRADVIDDLLDAWVPRERDELEAERLLVDRLTERGSLTEEDAAEIRQALEDRSRFDVDVYGRVQVRAIAYDGDDYVEGVPGDPNLRTGFQLKSARLGAAGKALFQWLGYSVSAEFAEEDDPLSIDVELLDAYLVATDLIPNHEILLGVAKTPFSRQQLKSSGRLLFQNRSIVVEQLEERFFDREVGASVWGSFALAEDGDLPVFLHYGVGLFNGSGEPGLKGDLNEGKLVTVRGQIDLFQRADRDESALHAEGLGMSLGGGFFYNDDVASEPLGFTVDAEVRLSALALGGGVIWVDFEPDLGEDVQVPPFASDFASLGWYAQGGYMVVPGRVELAVRYDAFDGNDEVDDNQDVSSVTAGVNLYAAEHDLKAMIDYVHRIEDEGADLENDSLMAMVQLLY